MQLSNLPLKFVLPFASSGTRRTIPTDSQIGITPGAASLVTGFPPLTFTPIAAGGVPPAGIDFNGLFYELSAIARWSNSGAGYPYDATFANDTNVGGYPRGARVLRSDGTGYWLNTVDNNVTDPEGGSAAGWVADVTAGLTSVALSSSNVTLTALQYGRPIILLTGTLTSNLNVVFPTIVAEWLVINNTSGPFTVTCKTASGTGVTVNNATMIVGDGTNIVGGITDVTAMMSETVSISTGGTVDAITAVFSPAPRYFTNGFMYNVRATGANTSTTPTFTPNSGVLAPKTIVKGNNLPLVAGDIAGAGHWLELMYDATFDRWVLLNPARGYLRQGLVAWANFDGTLPNGGITPRASFGISAITKTGLGAYTVTLSAAMADANYVVLIDGNSNSQVDSRDITSRTTTSFTFLTASNSTFSNWPTVGVAVIGNI